MVPDNWEVKKFGDLFSIKSGFGFKHSEYTNMGIPLIKIDNVSHGYVKWDNISYLPYNYREEYSDILLKENDLLLALNRPITQGMLKLVKLSHNDVPSILYQRVGRIDFKERDLERDFYFYLLDTEIFRFVSHKAIGSDQPFISTTELKKLNIAKPPVSEQKKIAKILSTWDKAINTTEKLLANSELQKKALMQQLLAGKKRFPGFSGEWKFSSFNDLFMVVNDKTKQVKSSDYLVNGSTPVVDQGQQLIAGYTNKTNPYQNVPVIIFGDHTRIIKWIDFSFCPGADGTQILKTQNPVKLKFGYYILCNTHISNLGYSRHLRELKEKEFKFPIDLHEQEKIDSVLSSTDQMIELLHKKLDSLKQEKKALMQQLLTGKRRVQV